MRPTLVIKSPSLRKLASFMLERVMIDQGEVEIVKEDTTMKISPVEVKTSHPEADTMKILPQEVVVEASEAAAVVLMKAVTVMKRDLREENTTMTDLREVVQEEEWAAKVQDITMKLPPEEVALFRSSIMAREAA